MGRFSLLVLMMPFFALAQGGEPVFKVKADGLKLFPETQTLYQNISQRFKLTGTGLSSIDTVIFAGGTARWKDSMLVLKPTKSKTVLLKIYGKAVEGQKPLLLMNEFFVQKFVEPKPNVDGVDNDSVIHRMKVVAQGYVNVPIKPDKELKRYSYKVLSFQLQTSRIGIIDTFKANSNRMTYAMRDAIDKMSDGSVIQVNNIRYIMGYDTFTIEQPLRVYIRNDTIVKF